MKKLTTLLLLTVLAVAGCASSLQKESADVIFEYQAMTRGSNKKVIINKGSVTTIDVTGRNKPVTASVAKEDWDALLAAAEKINLDKIEGLKAPSEKYKYDGALIATLKVTVKDKVYTSNSFDHGNPPAEIALLVNKIVSLSDLNKKASNED